MARIMTKTRKNLSNYCQRKSLIQSPPYPQPTQPETTRMLRSRTKAIAQTTICTERTNLKRRCKRSDLWNPKRKPNADCKPRTPPPTQFTCRICILTLPRGSFIRWVPTKGRRRHSLDAPNPCIQHLAPSPYRRNINPVCKVCIGSTMAARLDMLGAREVRSGCLEPGCDQIWPWEMIIKHFPLDKLEAFNLASFEHWRTDTDLFTCISPNCSFTGLLDSNAPGYPHVECPISSCKARSCAACLTPWHTDQTCAEAKSAALMTQMSDSEKETLALMQSRDGRRCPNCQLVIEKDGGCPSIRCAGCKVFFNWNTAASAMPGTKRALPILADWERDHWQNAGPVVCEVDALEGNIGNADELAGQIPLHFEGVFYGREVVEGPAIPLPNEEDADL